MILWLTFLSGSKINVTLDFKLPRCSVSTSNLRCATDASVTPTSINQYHQPQFYSSISPTSIRRVCYCRVVWTGPAVYEHHFIVGQINQKPRVLGKWMIRWLFILCFFLFWPTVHSQPHYTTTELKQLETVSECCLNLRSILPHTEAP